MTAIYIITVALIAVIVLCLRSKSKFIQVAGVLVTIFAGLALPPFYLKNSKEVDNNSFITVQEISASIEHAQDQDAAQLRAQIRASLADNKIMLSEFEQIGEAYRSYRAKYPLSH